MPFQKRHRAADRNPIVGLLLQPPQYGDVARLVETITDLATVAAAFSRQTAP
jgi:hypothetical protein